MAPCEQLLAVEGTNAQVGHALVLLAGLELFVFVGLIELNGDLDRLRKLIQKREIRRVPALDPLSRLPVLIAQPEGRHLLYHHLCVIEQDALLETVGERLLLAQQVETLVRTRLDAVGDHANPTADLAARGTSRRQGDEADGIAVPATKHAVLADEDVGMAESILPLGAHDQHGALQLTLNPVQQHQCRAIAVVSAAGPLLGLRDADVGLNGRCDQQRGDAERDQ